MKDTTDAYRALAAIWDGNANPNASKQIAIHTYDLLTPKNSLALF